MRFLPHRHAGLEPGPAFLLAAAVALASPAQAQPSGPPAATDYTRPANWLCRPGRDDVCARQPLVTALLPAGFGARIPAPRLADPAIDCFYVYPTVSHDDGLNSDLIPDAGEEKFAVQAQFVPFAGLCRPFAPLYRQMTMAAVATAATGGDIGLSARIAYGDVAAAWRHYLANDNHGRPFVLIGHSQGSALLIELIRREIEGKPVAARMKLAIIPGFDVLVPVGKRVGGSFKSTPLCGSPTETGCVFSWTTFRENNPPPPGAMFGFADQPGMTVGCTNPGRPGANGWVALDSIWHARSGLPVPGGPIEWSSEGPPPTGFVETPGLVSGRCVNDGPRGYLSLRTNADPTDKRTDRVGGEVGALGFFLPGWGMHLSDLSAPMGDLLRRVAALTPAPARTIARPAPPAPAPASARARPTG